MVTHSVQEEKIRSRRRKNTEHTNEEPPIPIVYARRLTSIILHARTIQDLEFLKLQRTFCVSESQGKNAVNHSCSPPVDPQQPERRVNLTASPKHHPCGGYIRNTPANLSQYYIMDLPVCRLSLDAAVLSLFQGAPSAGNKPCSAAGHHVRAAGRSDIGETRGIV